MSMPKLSVHKRRYLCMPVTGAIAIKVIWVTLNENGTTVYNKSYYGLKVMTKFKGK